MDINKLNLNLIRSLYALLTTKNTTLAAKKIGVSQSSMSMALKQLREKFNDELLVPGAHKIMHLTPLASSLTGRVREILSQIDRVFNSNTGFEADTSLRTFRIGMTDLVSIQLLQPLINEIETNAPNVQLKILHPKYLTSIDVFEMHQFDLLLGMFEDSPLNLKRQLLFKDEPVILCCKNHPITKSSQLNLDEFLKYPLIQFSLEDTPFENYTNKYLSQLSANKQVNVSVSQAIMSIVALPGTNYLTMTVKQVAEYFKDKIGISIYPVPFETESFICSQYWHPKDDNDPAHQWLRHTVKALVTK